MKIESIWTYLFHVICLFCFTFLSVSFAHAHADDKAKLSDLFQIKCEQLKPIPDSGPSFIIWDMESGQVHPCLGVGGNKDDLSEAISSLNENKLNALLKFRLNSPIEELNSRIPLSVMKVRTGKELGPLLSEYYNSPNAADSINRVPMPSDGNEPSTKEYLFFHKPDNKIKKKCILGLFSDGYKSGPISGEKIKKSCIFVSSPINLYWEPLKKIPKPELHISDTKAEEGNPLEFNVTRQDKPKVLTRFTYEILSETASDEDFKNPFRTYTIEFQPSETKKTIIVPTIDDETYEADEQIFIRMLSEYNAVVKNRQATGIIEDNDKVCSDGTVVSAYATCPKPCWDGTYSAPCPIKPPPPKSGPFSIADASADEGDPLAFTISREKPWDLPATINYNFEDGSAKSEIDYIPDTTQPVSFGIGDNEKTINVTTVRNDIWSKNKTFKVKIASEFGVKISSAQAIGTIINTDPSVICWDESEVANLNSCPAVIDCWDGSQVTNVSQCPSKPKCWNGQEVINLDDCPPCSMKPRTTLISFPVIDEIEYIKIEGIACPGHYVSFGVNEGFDNLQQIKVREDGTFSFLQKRNDFHGDAPYLNIHVASLDFRLSDPKPETLPDQLIYGSSRSFVPGNARCRDVEIVAMPAEPGTLTDKGLRLEEFYVEDRFGECELSIRGKAENYQTITIDYSYNPRGSRTETANASGDIYATIPIPELEKISTELTDALSALEVKLRVKNENGTETGTIEFKSWPLREVSNFLSIFYGLGEVSSDSERPSSRPFYNEIKIGKARQAVEDTTQSFPLYFFLPKLDSAVEQSIKNKIESDNTLNDQLKQNLFIILDRLKEKDYRAPNLDQAFLTIDELKNPENLEMSVIKYDPRDTVKDLKQSLNDTGRPLPFRNGAFEAIDEKFNKGVKLKSESTLRLKICAIDNPNICDDFTVNVPTYFELKREPIDPLKIFLVIGAVAGALLTIFQLLEYLFSGTGFFGRFFARFRGNRREIYLAMINAYPQTRDLNNDAINLWGYTNESGADINDEYSLGKQARRILDYVYNKVGEGEHIEKLIASKPANPKCQKLARHLPEAPRAD